MIASTYNLHVVAVLNHGGLCCTSARICYPSGILLFIFIYFLTMLQVTRSHSLTHAPLGTTALKAQVSRLPSPAQLERTCRTSELRPSRSVWTVIQVNISDHTSSRTGVILLKWATRIQHSTQPLFGRWMAYICELVRLSWELSFNVTFVCSCSCLGFCQFHISARSFFVTT